jgi:class 3 adenylate cyclase
MEDFDLDELLGDLDDDVRTELASKPEVIDKGHDLDPSDLPIEKRCWYRVTDVIAVVADLKNSTRLGLNKHAASTASIYEAATGGVVDVFDSFDADFVAIQGDGAFGLFWGEKRMARGVCAGITIKTYSERHLVPRLEKKWPSLPQTDLKVGIANSPILVKRVGVPRTDHQEPVWAGKAVNFAAKCAQQADRHEMIVTGSVWDWASGNDYLAVTCECDPPRSPSIWSDVTIEKLPDDDPDREGKRLTSLWCKIHGADYCANVLAGNSRRPDVRDERIKALKAEYLKAIRLKAQRDRAARSARRRGLANW